MYDLNQRIYPLLKDEPFWGYISRRTNKISSKKYPKAAIGLNKQGGFDLYYNPEYFDTLTDVQKTEVLKHEFSHPLFGHFNSRARYVGNSDERSKLTPENDENLSNHYEFKYAKRINVALDLAINSFLDKLPLDHNLCIPEHGLFKDFPKYKSHDWYFQRLEGMVLPYEECTFDAHLFPDNLTPEQEYILEQNIKNIMRGAYQECLRKNSWGSLSEQMRELLKTQLFGKLPWYKMISEFAQMTSSPTFENTRTLPNRKLSFLLPGRKSEQMSKLLVANDQSASVSEVLQEKFYAELKKLQRFATFETVNFDVEVDEKSLTKWEPGNNVKFFRTRTGGTDFQCVTDYFNKKKRWDGLIIMSDLYAPTPGPCIKKRMWVCDESESNSEFQTSEKIAKIPT